uniref:CENP-C n=1 Tax=Oryza rufipogon TaxID=4529 RepID=A0A0E0MZA8_ORYRU
MASADPFLAASSPAHLLPRTLGPAAPPGTAASPSAARGALLDGISRPLKGSKELVEQARMAMKAVGDIGKLYGGDGAGVAAAAADGKNNQLGRRPAPDRKRFRLKTKPPANKPVQNVDYTELLNIEDPDEYFLTLEKLERADKEIKRLRGEVPTEGTYNNRGIEPPKLRPGLLRRKSVHSYKFSASSDAPDAIEAPASQTETVTESQTTQDDVHGSAHEMTTEPVSSRSSQDAIPDISAREDSFVWKDNSFTLNYLLSAFKDLDEDEEENLLRKTLQIKEISIGKVCLPDFNVPGDTPASNTTEQKNPMSDHALERSAPGSNLARISQLEKRIFVGDALEDKHADLSKDDESDGSPESLLCKQSPVRRSSDAVGLMINEGSTAMETSSPSIKSPEHVLESESNPPDGVTTDEQPTENSPIGVDRDSELVKEKGTSSRHSVSLEEDVMPIDCTVSPPDHLEGGSTEVLTNITSRNVSPLHHGDGNSEHQEIVGGDVAQDNPIHTSETPPMDTNPQNQSEIHRGSIEKLAVDKSNALSPSKGKEQRGKNKKQPSKRGKRKTDNLIHTPEIPPEDTDNTVHTPEIPPEDTYPQNQSEIHRGNTEKLAVDINNALSPSKGKEQRGNNKKQPSKRQKRAAGEAGDLETHAPNFEPEIQPHVQDTDDEQQPACTSQSPSPSNGTSKNEVRKRNKKQDLNRRKSLADAGLTWQAGVRRSTRIRSKPLQHWLGERFIYGRIHGTMATVIGVKSFSPSQEGKGPLRVKSFVPEQFSDLLAESAKY